MKLEELRQKVNTVISSDQKEYTPVEMAFKRKLKADSIGELFTLIEEQKDRKEDVESVQRELESVLDRLWDGTIFDNLLTITYGTRELRSKYLVDVSAESSDFDVFVQDYLSLIQQVDAALMERLDSTRNEISRNEKFLGRKPSAQEIRLTLLEIIEGNRALDKVINGVSSPTFSNDNAFVIMPAKLYDLLRANEDPYVEHSPCRNFSIVSGLKVMSDKIHSAPCVREDTIYFVIDRQQAITSSKNSYVSLTNRIKTRVSFKVDIKKAEIFKLRVKG